MYTTQKNLNKLMNYQSTFFLDPLEQDKLKRKIGKLDYNIYLPFKDSEKAIYYMIDEPEVLLYEIISKQELRHQDILGTMFSLNISNELFGDIILDNGRYFIYILPIVRNYFEANLLKIKNTSVTLKELDIDYLKDYERKYEECQIICSSERIDTVISTIIHTNRGNIKDRIKDKDILLNYDYLKSNSYILKSGDIFSIRKFGKYKYIGIVKQTKKDNFILSYLKYL